ncbi:carbon-nitrogen hydrolase family protein [Polymorphobacter sp. PAMC 29334]|uniref:carbon-nitrogen hydrolase family protein n=1 Tax=Polymorphobacter sp. PAMC 29334 TaxID=2862331 RepID=UPI001C76A80A|nr:carbon-nitrogen hydrolase family protein [Polymorphobacter sp. PAMC 29334]QYE33753.1 carbon-nitrogen hydrolase family protein [Polymorphobacter sp. PAMC 29334]
MAPPPVCARPPCQSGARTILGRSATMPMISISIIQSPPVFLNLPASIVCAERLIREAAGNGADVIVFPEAWLPGYPVWLDDAPGSALFGHKPAEALFRVLLHNCPELEGREIARLAALSAELSVEIVMGIQERRGSSIFNTVVRLTPGRRDIHRKMMPTHNERLIWAAADGSTLGPWPGKYGPVGALICWEHWMPLARAARHQHGQVLHFALWPAVTELHLLASRHYAFEGQCFVAAAGTVLTRSQVFDGFDSLETDEPAARAMLEAIPAERELLKSGGSAIVGPDATIIAAAGQHDTLTLNAVIGTDIVAEGRLYLDTVGHYSRPDIFELQIDMRERPGLRTLI